MVYAIKRSLLLLFSTLSAIHASTTFAEDEEQRWYTVELIVFEQYPDYRWDQELVEQNASVGIDRNNTVDLLPFQLAPFVEPEENSASEEPVQAVIDEEISETLQQVSDATTVTNHTDDTLTEPTTESGTTSETVMEVQEQAFEWPVPFSIPDVDQFQLSENARKIDINSKLNLLLHTAWSQPGLDDDHAIAVNIHDQIENVALLQVNTNPVDLQNSENETDNQVAGNTSLVQTNPIEITQDVKFNLLDNITNTNTAPNADPKGSDENGEVKSVSVFDSIYEETTELVKPQESFKKFEGIIRLRLKRYLHLDVDLLYYEQNPPMIVNSQKELSDNWLSIDTLIDTQPIDLYQSDIESDYQNSNKPIAYHFTHSRKMRSNELHYIDHPRLGILALVTPIEAPEEPENPDTKDN
jgi:hypothetical protein